MLSDILHHRTNFIPRLVFISMVIFSLPVLAVKSSATLAQPSGTVILEVNGAVSLTNGEGAARFDYDMLQSLGLVTVQIDSPWVAEGSRFEGVLARDLMNMVGASGEEIHAQAADGYVVTIPFSDLVEHDTLLALSMNGKRMGLRDRGPVWIIYDNSDRPEISETLINSRMIWQLKSLTVR